MQGGVAATLSPVAAPQALRQPYAPQGGLLERLLTGVLTQPSKNVASGHFHIKATSEKVRGQLLKIPPKPPPRTSEGPP